MVSRLRFHSGFTPGVSLARLYRGKLDEARGNQPSAKGLGWQKSDGLLHGATLRIHGCGVSSRARR
eukprot:scaffold107633_cov27-Tisochrysis_lutea.AAC.1